MSSAVVVAWAVCAASLIGLTAPSARANPTLEFSSTSSAIDVAYGACTLYGRTTGGNVNGWRALAYGNGAFLAMRSDGRIFRSTNDGSTWSQSGVLEGAPTGSSPLTSCINRNGFLAYGAPGGVPTWVAALKNEHQLFSSVDNGLTWTLRATLDGTNEVLKLAYGGGVFIVGHSGGGSVVSSNGTSWSDGGALTGGGGSAGGATYGNGSFVVPIGQSRSVCTSTTGSSFNCDADVLQDDGSSPYYPWRDIVAGSGLVVGAVGAAEFSIDVGKSLQRSPLPQFADESPRAWNWQFPSSGMSARVSGLAYGDGWFVADSFSGAPLSWNATGTTTGAVFSKDGLTWSSAGVTTGTTGAAGRTFTSEYGSRLAFGNHYFVGIGDNGTVSRALAPTPPPGPLTFSSGAFGSTAFGSSGSLTVTVTNTGGTSAVPTGVTVAGTGVSVEAATCAVGAPIAPSGSCTVNLTWTPTGPGELSGASLTITYPDGPSPSHSLALSGTAAYAALTPTFGPVTSMPDGFTVDVTNHDGAYGWAASTTAGSAAISGAGQITVTGLNPAESATVTVTSTRAGYAQGSAPVTGVATAPTPEPAPDTNSTPGATPMQTPTATATPTSTVVSSAAPVAEATERPSGTPSQSASVPAGVALLSGTERANAQIVTVSAPVSTSMATAPQVTVAAGSPVAPVVGGLPPSTPLQAAMSAAPVTRAKPSFVSIGTTRSNATGRAKVPAFKATRPGIYTIRLSTPGGKAFYLKVKVATKKGSGTSAKAAR